jgi:hypothetical protein
MKIALFAMLFAASAFAQNPSAGLPAACGPRDASFNVKLNKSQHTLGQPESGKARVYFIQDSYPVTTNIGVDGTWVGANRESSYFSVSVEPGVHHLCANIQSHAVGHQMGLAYFTAEAGGTYYYRMRLFSAFFALDPVNSDEAGRMIAAYPLSASTPMK